jgi:hypothetical protein
MLLRGLQWATNADGMAVRMIAPYEDYYSSAARAAENRRIIEETRPVVIRRLEDVNERMDAHG